VGKRVVDTYSADADGANFFKALIDELCLREPTLRPGTEEPPTKRTGKVRTLKSSSPTVQAKDRRRQSIEALPALR
jgi:hypothetical protein